ncbi:S1 family peptidase [Aliivibrio salmonicida]|uniref:S1 family peptidase n=1 Tax=Aliivibrio salmonicida TaxID=40269 RepID=UPI00406C9F58
MKVFIGLALSLFSFASNAEEVTVTPYVVGGANADVANFPFMASLMFEYDSQPGTIYPFCGGSVLDATHILTAAHCVYDTAAYLVPSMKVVIGVNNAQDMLIAQKVAVKNIYYPSDYNDSTLVNDVAVLELSQPLPTYASANEVTLGTSGDELSYRDENQDFTIVGYGRLGTNQKNPNLQFMEASVNYVSAAHCGLWQGITITDKLICTNGNSNPALVTATCQGDSGGPLIWNNKQIGIVSFGPATCGQESVAAQSVFTDVSQYKDWILQAQRGEIAPTTTATESSGSSGGAFTFGGLLALCFVGFSRRKLN